MFFPEFHPGAFRYCDYSDADRVLLEQVLVNWKVWDLEGKFKILHYYLEHVNADIYGPYSRQVSPELRTLKRILCIMDDEEREFQIACYNGYAKLHRANKRLFKVKAAMLDFCKSQMKAATLLDFLKSLVNLPEEFSASPLKDASMLDFFKSLVDLGLPEKHINWALQKLVEKDMNSACKDARKSFEENKYSEMSYIRKLRKELGVEYHEEHLTDEECLCTDMDSFKKRLKVMEDEVAQNSDNVQRVNHSWSYLACETYVSEVKDFIRLLESY